VLRRLHDDADLEALTERAFDEIIASEKYSYQALVRLCDDAIARHWASGAFPVRARTPWLPLPPCDAVAGFPRKYAESFRAGVPWPQRAWLALPAWLRSSLRPLVSRERWKRRWQSLTGSPRPRPSLPPGR
jgi:hypothetical protein